jgi:predicted RNA-binding protein YlxR (DUF448 family)
MTGQTAKDHKAKPAHTQRQMPVRTCVACQQARTKRELVRVVHTAAGVVEVDPTGKKAGRGAYLCPKRSCWQLGLKKKALDRALKTTIGPDNVAVLEAYAATLRDQ